MNTTRDNTSPMYEEPAVFTPEQLATRWQVHVETVYRRLREGDISFFNIGRQKRIPASEVRRIEQKEAAA